MAVGVRLLYHVPLSHLGVMTPNVTILAALLAGLVSFLSPCVLPLVPPYLVYLAGTSFERLADAEPEPRVRRETVVAALLFVAGFSTVFVALGASASLIGAGAPIPTFWQPLLALQSSRACTFGLTRIGLLYREKRRDR